MKAQFSFWPSKFLTGCLLFLSTTVFAVPQAKPKTIHWLVAHGPYAVVEPAFNEFRATIRRESHGTLDADVTFAREKGQTEMPPKQVLQQVESGQVQMAQVYTTALGRYDSRFHALDLPFLFRNHDHVSAVLDGDIGKDLLASLNTHGMEGAAFTYSGGFRMIATKDKEIHKLEDFKGLRIALQAPRWTKVSPEGENFLLKLGAIPQRIERKDLGLAVAEGKLDGFVNIYTRLGGTPGEREAIHVVNDTAHSLHLTAIVFNAKFLAGLTPEERMIVRKATTRAALHERLTSIQLADVAKKSLQEKGVRIVKMSEAEHLRFENAFNGYEKEFSKLFSVEWVAKIRQTADNPNWRVGANP